MFSKFRFGKQILRGLKKKLAVTVYPCYLKVQKSVIQSNRSFISRQVLYQTQGHLSIKHALKGELSLKSKLIADRGNLSKPDDSVNQLTS